MNNFMHPEAGRSREISGSWTLGHVRIVQGCISIYGPEAWSLWFGFHHVRGHQF